MNFEFRIMNAEVKDKIRAAKIGGTSSFRMLTSSF
jgi:hypothetical protein